MTSRPPTMKPQLWFPAVLRAITALALAASLAACGSSASPTAAAPDAATSRFGQSGLLMTVWSPPGLVRITTTPPPCRDGKVKVYLMGGDQTRVTYATPDDGAMFPSTGSGQYVVDEACVANPGSQTRYVLLVTAPGPPQ